MDKEKKIYIVDSMMIDTQESQQIFSELKTEINFKVDMTAANKFYKIERQEHQERNTQHYISVDNAVDELFRNLVEELAVKKAFETKSTDVVVDSAEIIDNVLKYEREYNNEKILIEERDRLEHELKAYRWEDNYFFSFENEGKKISAKISRINNTVKQDIDLLKSVNLNELKIEALFNELNLLNLDNAKLLKQNKELEEKEETERKKVLRELADSEEEIEIETTTTKKIKVVYVEIE